MSLREDVVDLADRINGLASSIQDLKASIPSLTRGEINTFLNGRDSWFKRNAYWFFPFLSVVATLFLGSGFFAWVGGTLLDRRIDDRLTGIKSEVSELRKDIQKNAVEIGKLSSSVEYLVRQATAGLAKDLRRAAATPRDPTSQARVRQIIAQARATGAPIPGPVIQEVGSSFASADDDEGSWGVTAELASYQSSRNDSLDATRSMQLAKGETRIHFSAPQGSPPAEQFSYGLAAQNDAPRAELIDQPVSQPAAYGPSLIKFVGGTLMLDGYRFRHIVIKGVQVWYRGGRVILDDVLFIDCQFVTPPNESSRRLITKILEQPKIDFAVQ